MIDEATLRRAAATGEALRSLDGDDLVVPGGLLRELFRRDPQDLDPRGLTLESARVADGLDLRGMQIPFPLRFVGCAFDRPLDLDGAELHALVLDGCDVPGVVANGLRVRRDLDLSRSRVRGDLWTSASTSCSAAVWLCESEIGGRLLCVDTVIDGAVRAVQADRMRVGGTIRLLHGFEARGGIRLLGADVAGSLDLTGARLTRPDRGLALDLGDATIGGSVFVIADQTGRRPLVRGRLALGNARIAGQLLIRDADFEPAGTVTGTGYRSRRRAGAAISAPGLVVNGDVSIEGECRIGGGVDLSMGTYSTIQIHEGTRLAAPGERALDLTNAELRSSLVLAEGVAVEGTLRLAGAHVRGDLVLKGTRWSEPEGPTIVAAEGATVDGGVDLRGVETCGGRITFRSATVGATFDAHGARLRNTDGGALSLRQAVVKGSVLLAGGFTAEGSVVLNRAVIEGRLACAGGTFGDVVAASATARAGMNLHWTAAASVDLTGAVTTALADDPAAWPRRSAIAGFVYDRFDGSWDWRTRRDWLRGMEPFDAGPYEQAARVFRQHGRPVEAERLLMEQRRRARQVRPPGGRAPGRLLRDLRDVLYGVTVGYGYRPGRTLWLLAALLALVGTLVAVPGAQATLRATDPRGNVYAVDGRLVTVDETKQGADATATRARAASRPGPCGDGQVRCFDPVFYTIDTVVPLISLGQRAVWYPETRTTAGRVTSALLNVASVLGWLLSTVVVLSFARLARPA
ncbi:hypothetical protein [Nonomuraea rhodomycinica]|uniref:Membrane-associated oxidoreductase n=1 Tax=Nonomuraea rhodomycinica TaxID=1712872 RepID=A0A7Y6ILE0_9ACTN|nr:hypothetical protein [Nonomuraea rhodomycinica]NUW40228.1 hypothetical protein [Nonomuraea rhodomycinica]